MAAVLLVVATIGRVAASVQHDTSTKLLRAHQNLDEYNYLGKLHGLRVHSTTINAAAAIQERRIAQTRDEPDGNESFATQDIAEHNPTILGFGDPIPLDANDTALAKFEDDLEPVENSSHNLKNTTKPEEEICGDVGKMWCHQCWEVRADVPKGSGTCLQSFQKHQCVDPGMTWCPDVKLAKDVKKVMNWTDKVYTTTASPFNAGAFALRFLQHRIEDESWHCYVDPDRSGQVHEMQKECADPDNSFCNGVICSKQYACRMQAVKMEGVVYRRARNAATIAYVASPTVAIPEWVAPRLMNVMDTERTCNSLLAANLVCRGFSCFNFTTVGKYACALLAEAIPVTDRFEKVVVPTSKEPSPLRSRENDHYWDSCFPAARGATWLGTIPVGYHPLSDTPTLNRQNVDQNLSVSADSWRGSAHTVGAEGESFEHYTIQRFTDVAGNDVLLKVGGDSSALSTSLTYTTGLTECVEVCNADDRCKGFVSVLASTDSSGTTTSFAKCVFKDTVALTKQGAQGEDLYTKPIPDIDDIPAEAYENVNASAANSTASANISANSSANVSATTSADTSPTTTAAP